MHRGKKLKSTTKEGLDIDDEDEKMPGLDEVIVPEWSMERFGRPGRLCFADCTQPFQKHALDLRLYQALQGLCAWILALLFGADRTDRADDLADHLWEFCNWDALSALVFCKGALGFQRGAREARCKRAAWKRVGQVDDGGWWCFIQILGLEAAPGLGMAHGC
eukprot:g3506.t1